MKLTIDFETRSEAKIGDVGAWAYSLHPTTDVLCLGWSEDGLLTGQWRMDDELPTELFDLTDQADIVEAHNSFFEICIWQHVCHKRYGWPPIPLKKWQCSAAKAALNSLPRGLEDAGRALHLSVVKDTGEGKWATLKLSRPRKPTKTDSSTWYNDPEDWTKMLRYNTTDIEAEEAISDNLPPWPETELKLAQLTERMNIRGIPIDIKGVKQAIQIAGQQAEILTKQFQKLTGLKTAGQRAKFIVWMASKGVQIENTQAETLDNLLVKGTHSAEVNQAVSIVRSLGRSSIKKYRTMLAMAEYDGRAHGCFKYCGAAATGRWSGSGMQPQNFPRDTPIKNQDVAWRGIYTGDLDILSMMAEPLEALSGALRGAIKAPKGRRLMCGDYSQIEARIIFWLAGEKEALEVFRRGEDMYCVMASTIYNRTITKADALERFLGKQAVLALGFGAGFVKFLVHCRALGAPAFTREQIAKLVPPGQFNASLQWIMDKGWSMVTNLIPNATRRDAEELVMTKFIVDKYRARYKDTVIALWNKLEVCARAAIAQPGTNFQVNDKLSYKRIGRQLQCKLPSGRPLIYWDPSISHANDIMYMGHENGQWAPQKTYGGKLAENATQACARDVMGAAKLRLEAHPPYDELVLSIHDEAGIEIDNDKGDLKEFLRLMGIAPAWAKGLPVAVEGWEAERYHK